MKTVATNDCLNLLLQFLDVMLSICEQIYVFEWMGLEMITAGVKSEIVKNQQQQHFMM